MSEECWRGSSAGRYNKASRSTQERCKHLYLVRHLSSRTMDCSGKSKEILIGMARARSKRKVLVL